MSYIDGLIENGTNFEVRRGEGSASFTPVSGRDEDLEAFQSVVRQLRRNEGDAYEIHIEHLMSNRPGDFVDLMIVQFKNR